MPAIKDLQGQLAEAETVAYVALGKYDSGDGVLAVTDARLLFRNNYHGPSDGPKMWAMPYDENLRISASRDVQHVIGFRWAFQDLVIRFEDMLRSRPP